jgi:hypothetical protein
LNTCKYFEFIFIGFYFQFCYMYWD